MSSETISLSRKSEIISRWDRAVTPVVSTVLVVRIIMVLDTTISVSLFSATEDLNEAAPIVG